MPRSASQLLDLCPQAGISVVAAVESDARVPRQAKATMGCVPQIGGTLALSTVWFTDPEVAPEHLELEPANARLIDQVAMSLAPLRDATAASATTAIPRIVPLLSLFGPELPTPLSIAREWAQPKPYSLRAPIGIGPSGPLELDLVEHGPHALIGGTSGAGKSELLQSIVAALIHEYPPTRLTFLFVDYKGGAASVVFNDVPHTVGYVTNLEASLSLRALTSLRAELNHRMRLMEGKAKDLAEMIERYPDEAPPSLVIVVDEFATLVKEVPDFVAGVVDIAQRGRSLGVHLILATQRPSGSVNDNILANTNLRISLRMLDSVESKTIIGVGSAAEIPLPLKGRGFAKLGPRDLIEFQSAFTGRAAHPGERSDPRDGRAVREHGAPGGHDDDRWQPHEPRWPQVNRQHDTGADADLQRSGDGRAGPSCRPADAAAVEGRRVAASHRCAVRCAATPASAGDTRAGRRAAPGSRWSRSDDPSRPASRRRARRIAEPPAAAQAVARDAPRAAAVGLDRIACLHVGTARQGPVHHARDARRPSSPGPVPGSVRPRGGWRLADRRRGWLRQDQRVAHGRHVLRWTVPPPTRLPSS